MLALAAPVFAPLCQAAAPPASAPAEGGLTGFWALRYDSRNVPPAHLLPSVTSEAIAAHRRSDAQVIRWCRQVGMPLLMDSGAPLDIVQGRSQVAIIAQIPAAARHIYLDRSAPPSPDAYDPAANGFSIGHWDGHTLWVHTTGFSDKAYTRLPGGGFRTAHSELTERYQLVDDGRELEVTFTWTDPTVFTQPHSYAFRYVRVPRSYNAGEVFCDSHDPGRSAFLSTPPATLRMPAP